MMQDQATDNKTPQPVPPTDASHEEVFDKGQTFESLGLRTSVLKGVEAAGFKHPTVVQAQLIPPMMSGKDLLGQARTGSGKTAAFGLPLLCLCEKDVPAQALVLVPTRELAMQVTAEINDLGRFTPIRAASIFGGEQIRGQAERLKKGGHIIVGTPGRVMDMAQRGHFSFRGIRFAVLDEVDRMLDIGFRDDIRRILEQCPPPGKRQTVMVSATISGEIERLARKQMHDAEKIVVAAGSLTVNSVEQHYLAVNPWDKKHLLIHLLTHEEPAMTLVFCRLKRKVDELARALNAAGIDARAIHGDMPQGKRNTVMKQLRGGELTVLVASDLASRGIDVEDISHVVNYDLPEDPEVYVHRIGRTARAGRKGVAWSLVTPEQGPLLTEIEMLINREVPKMDYHDFKPTPKPAEYRDERPAAGGLIRADVAPAAAPPTEPEAKVSRLQRAAQMEPPAAADPSKFPGGLVPTKMPPKRMHGRVPRR
ncbi:MAG: DEAD/DEAH box helicase [Phycisphaerae bacterium]|nr:DEAD/DEAH box helicase [Phycisphaerae bacterium]